METENRHAEEARDEVQALLPPALPDAVFLLIGKQPLASPQPQVQLGLVGDRTGTQSEIHDTPWMDNTDNRV